MTPLVVAIYPLCGHIVEVLAPFTEVFVGVDGQYLQSPFVLQCGDYLRLLHRLANIATHSAPRVVDVDYYEVVF